MLKVKGTISMKTRCLNTILPGLMVCISTFCWGGETNVSMRIKFRDGSYLTGEPKFKEMQITAQSLPDKIVSIPLDLIRSITVSSNEVKISCRNGDRITGISRVNRIQVQSSIGLIAIDLEYISDIDVVAPGMLAPYNRYEGLIAYWPFDAGADDYSGHGLKGTVIGAALTEDRNENNDCAFEFNGRSDYIEINNQPLDLSDQMSIGAWIYPTGNSGADRAIIGKSTRVNYAGEFLFTIAINGKLRCHINNNPSRPGGDVAFEPWYFDGKTPLELNKWHHVFATWNGNTIILYLNGEEDSRRASYSGRMPTDKQPIIIGTSDDKALWFKGKIDDVVIYNKALSADQVRHLYQSK